MSAVFITEQEAYAHVAKPFNPPSIEKAADEEGFYAEWHSARRGFERVLNRFGIPDAYGQADYHMGDSAVLSRGIGVCITSSKLLVPDLLTQTQGYLASLGHSYEIDFTVATRDGDFEIFVTSDRILAWCPELVRQQLGI